MEFKNFGDEFVLIGKREDFLWLKLALMLTDAYGKGLEDMEAIDKTTTEVLELLKEIR